MKMEKCNCLNFCKKMEKPGIFPNFDRIGTLLLYFYRKKAHYPLAKFLFAGYSVAMYKNLLKTKGQCNYEQDLLSLCVFLR